MSYNKIDIFIGYELQKKLLRYDAVPRTADRSLGKGSDISPKDGEHSIQSLASSPSHACHPHAKALSVLGCLRMVQKTAYNGKTARIS